MRDSKKQFHENILKALQKNLEDDRNVKVGH